MTPAMARASAMAPPLDLNAVSVKTWRSWCAKSAQRMVLRKSAGKEVEDYYVGGACAATWKINFLPKIPHFAVGGAARKPLWGAAYAIPRKDWCCLRYLSFAGVSLNCGNPRHDLHVANQECIRFEAWPAVCTYFHSDYVKMQNACFAGKGGGCHSENATSAR
jgi:hypothetical protein